MPAFRGSTLLAALDRCRAAVDRRLGELVPPVDAGDSLQAAMHAAVNSPGKRLRPALVLLIGEAFSQPGKALVDLACVVELVHAASLVLDDLPCMDDSPTRRGEPSVHRRFGEATAILGAFALLTRAQAMLPQALAATGVPPAHRRELEPRFALAVEALCRGQELDLKLPTLGADLARLESIHADKTGALFELAAELGGAAAGLRGARLAALLAYARNLGLAFQVSDDLLDVVGESARLGKPTGQDAARARVTFVSVFGVAGARAICDDLAGAARQALAPFAREAELLRDLAEHVRTRAS
ncbi:MAG: polyprenyl synthetase family protein [Acidobacteriota bacterium]